MTFRHSRPGCSLSPFFTGEWVKYVCDELDFAVVDDPALSRAYKVPSLRGAALRPPYMHAGQFATLEEVVAHYNRAPAAPVGKSELEPLALTAGERRQLVAFLRSLDPDRN